MAVCVMSFELPLYRSLSNIVIMHVLPRRLGVRRLKTPLWPPVIQCKGYSCVLKRTAPRVGDLAEGLHSGA